MKTSPLRIGIVGFSSNKFDQDSARQILTTELRSLKDKHPHRAIEIVSGYTNMGIPKIAYEIADELGMITVGFTARQALRVKSGLYPVDKVIIEGERFGDESRAFVRYIDGLIRIGGGPQSRREVRLFKGRNRDKPLERILKEYEVSWFGEAHPSQAIADIRGLDYIENFITKAEHDELIQRIDGETWSNELSRRVQHYGYKYDYRNRAINPEMKVDDLPAWTKLIKERIAEEYLMPMEPDQMIVNEYLPGQGIADHIDCEPCFGDIIISLSLGSQAAMNFTEASTNQRIELPLIPMSILVLRDQARYQWKHGIVGRKSDVIKGQRCPRGRRISLTFRKVILSR